jgi:hypothetical protein
MIWLIPAVIFYAVFLRVAYFLNPLNDASPGSRPAHEKEVR